MADRGTYGTIDGRGAYAPRPGGWKIVVVVVGLAATAYLLWPRKREVPPEATTAADLEQIARDKGFPSVQAYEDAVIAVARAQQAAGATVALAPHAAHLAPQLAPDRSEPA